MPHYTIYCRDKPDTADQRKAASPAHLKHVEEHLDQYFVAGPLKNETGETIGSLLIVEAGNLDDARRFIESDPYHAAGFWESVHIELFMPAAGDWVGGKNW